MTETEEALRNIVLLVAILIVVRFIWLILAAAFFRRKISNEELGFLIAIVLIPVMIYSFIKVLFKRRDKDESV